jgi:hypothetical protein
MRLIRGLSVPFVVILKAVAFQPLGWPRSRVGFFRFRRFGTSARTTRSCH